MISRRHCVFLLRGGHVWVEDLVSRNGTRLDGEPVVGPRLLRNGATLQLAHMTFTVRLDGSPAEKRFQAAGSHERQ
jgi:pSer/pThr/pTyr-binding forkhead associated (FHA) protein